MLSVGRVTFVRRALSVEYAMCELRLSRVGLVRIASVEPSSFALFTRPALGRNFCALGQVTFQKSVSREFKFRADEQCKHMKLKANFTQLAPSLRLADSSQDAGIFATVEKRALQGSNFSLDLLKSFDRFRSGSLKSKE